MNLQPVNVLVVDDSPTICGALTTIIQQDPQLRVIGTAHNGREAIEAVARLKPNIVTMDFGMPEMDGLEAIKQIMAYHPTPILVISSTIMRQGERNRVFEAMQYGALDVMDKQPFHMGTGVTELCGRLKTLARVRVITHPLAKFQSRYERTPAIAAAAGTPRAERRIVALASSTGGPQALLKVLRKLPATLPCGVVVVQHISEGFDRGLAEWLDDGVELIVKLATDGELIKPGTVYIAPNKVQVRVAAGERIQFTDEPPCDGQKPSGTILFDSVAAVYGPRAVCAILTGMGRDGADGLRRVKAAGGFVIAESEESCVVFGMPKAAIELQATDVVRPLEEIPTAILHALAQPVTKTEVRR